MKSILLLAPILSTALSVCWAEETAEPVNVARPEWGAVATASSFSSPDYEAENALDGRWANRPTDKWNTAAGAGNKPHWLLIDLGWPIPIDRIVVRHEGAYADGDTCNTADFRLQRADNAAGPWTDLVEPIVGNRLDVTTHTFDSVMTRFVRLFVTKGTPIDNSYARIYEVEVYTSNKNFKLEVPDIRMAEILLRRATTGDLTEQELQQAAAFLDHADPFVRGIAEWTLARKVARDNNFEQVKWHADSAADSWFGRWMAITPAERVRMDWVRQAVALKMHNDPSRLVASVDAMIDRVQRMGRSVPPALSAVREKMEAAGTIEATRGLWLDARAALRPVAFDRAELDFDRIVLYTRFALHVKPNVCGVHTSWSYKPGGDVVVLDGIENVRSVRPLVAGRLGPGHVHGVDLSFDAERVAFAWAPQPEWPPRFSTYWPRGKNNDCYAFELRNTTEPPHLYEMDLASGRIEQLTDHNFWSDVEPTYCPDGTIAFTSDRSAHSPSCDGRNNDLTDHNLYSLSADRRTIRRLTNQKDIDMHPHLLENGLIGYLRWEYQERHFHDVHSVWTVRPDGTMADALFKQHLGRPSSVRDARSIPGTGKLVAIAAGHHTLPKGPIVLLNPAAGVNNQAAIELLTHGSMPQERSETWRGPNTWEHMGAATGRRRRRGRCGRVLHDALCGVREDVPRFVCVRQQGGPSIHLWTP